MTLVRLNPTHGAVLTLLSAGTKIIGHPYHGGDNQRWDIRDAYVISKLNGLVLDLEGSNTEPGAR